MAILAERAPDDATASYLRDVFAPTARAIDGLEQALRLAGLLDAALHLDLRRPQDYFLHAGRVIIRRWKEMHDALVEMSEGRTSHDADVEDAQPPPAPELVIERP